MADTPKIKRVAKFIAAVLIPLILLVLVIRPLMTQWDQVSAYDWQFQPAWLLVSAVLMWLDIVILILLWRSLIHEISGRPFPFWAAYRISVLSNLGKYLPGRVWAVMGMMWFLKREGYPPTVALASTALHQAFTVVAGAGFLIVVLGPKFFKGLPLLPLVLGLGGSLIVLYPPVFSRVLNWGLRLFKRDPVLIPHSFPRMLVRYLGYIAAWVTYGLSMWCMVRGVGIETTAFWPVVASFGASYLIGFLALFAPGGIGVREGMITVLLLPYVPAGLPAAIAVLARIWTTLVELVGLLPVLPGLKTLRSDQNSRSAKDGAGESQHESPK